MEKILPIPLKLNTPNTSGCLTSLNVVRLVNFHLKYPYRIWISLSDEGEE